MVRVGHILASNVKYIFLGGIVYINIINDAAECTTEIFRSDSKKKIHTSYSSDSVLVQVSYITIFQDLFELGAINLSIPAVNNLIRSCNI